MSPACKHSVRKLIRSARKIIPSRNSQALVGKILDLRQSCFPGAGRVCEETTGVAVRKRREPKNNIDPTHPASRVRLLERSNGFPEFFSRPEERASRRSRESRPCDAPTRARFRSGPDGRIAATALPALPIRRRRALGCCARLSPLPVRFLQAHVQYPD